MIQTVRLFSQRTGVRHAQFFVPHASTACACVLSFMKPPRSAKLCLLCRLKCAASMNAMQPHSCNFCFLVHTGIHACVSLCVD